jgi:hypothetical protein
MSDIFDNVSRRLASDVSRRGTFKILGGAAATAVVGRVMWPARSYAQTTCTPGATQPCYTGPAGTQGVGICHGGTQTCLANGTWGMCQGQQTPVAEICGNGLDDDCDGVVDNGCVTCPAGQVACSGTCVDTQSDPSNCGGCGLRCNFPNAIGACASGACHLAGCNPGFADCNGNPADGCETNIRTDNNNCGACGHVCAAGTVCTNGVCGPPPAVAEISEPVLIPAVGAAAFGAGWLHHRRRVRRAAEGPAGGPSPGGG